MAAMILVEALPSRDARRILGVGDFDGVLHGFQFIESSEMSSSLGQG
jgi:hypothetical protein